MTSTNPQLRTIFDLYGVQEQRVCVNATYASTEDEPDEFTAVFPTNYTFQQIHDALVQSLLANPLRAHVRCPHVTLEVVEFAYVQTAPHGKRRVSDTIPVMHVRLTRPHSIFACPAVS